MTRRIPTTRIVSALMLTALLLAAVLQARPASALYQDLIWTSKANMATGVAAPAAVAGSNGQIYSFGGVVGLFASNTAQAYDPGANTWTPLPNTGFTARYGAAAAQAADGTILVVGGKASSDTSFSAEAYDPATQTWSAKAPLNVARGFTTAVTLNGKVYAIGGTPTSTTNSTNTVEVYDAVTNSWSFVAPLNVGRWGLASVAHSGKIYTFGGSVGTTMSNAAEVYDPSAGPLGTWTVLPPLLPARRLHGAVSLNGKIYLIGGGTPGVTNTVTEFNPATNTYIPRPFPLITARQQHGAVVSGSNIYVFGGRDSSGTIIASTEMASVDPGAAPTVNVQPTDQLAAAGDPVTFSAAASGDPMPTVQWQMKPAGGAFSNVPGATATTLGFTSTALDNGKQYRAVFTNAAGSATSSAATLSVTVPDTAPPTISGSRTPAANGAGWNNTAVTVTFFCADDVAVASCTDPVVLSSGGAGQSVTGTAVDTSGNSASTTVGPINIDLTAPTATITSPASIYLLNQVVPAVFNCGDAQSGIVSCTGPATVDTSSVGAHTFTVTATDAAGNTSITAHAYNVAYNVCALYDQTKAVKSGSTIPVKLQLCDANGVNKSSAGITVTATGVTVPAVTLYGTPKASGNANPDSNFRYDATLGVTGGYIYNLSTKRLAPGTYKLWFTTSGDPTPHYVTFIIK